MINSNVAISDSGIIFNPGTGETFILNEMGLEIMMLIKNNLTQQEICKIILDTYETDPITVENDLCDFIYKLTRNQIITGNDK
jgi:hypothetical protein